MNGVVSLCLFMQIKSIPDFHGGSNTTESLTVISWLGLRVLKEERKGNRFLDCKDCKLLEAGYGHTVYH